MNFKMSVGVASEGDPDCDNVLNRLGQYLRDFDAELVGTLLDTFLRDTQNGLIALRTAIEGSNSDHAARVSHRLKGSYLCMGANGSAELCANLETRARSGLMDGAPGLMNSLEEKFARLAARLEMER
jgi:HPt (histidine-containing phosphotransfer) domain-containing protein